MNISKRESAVLAVAAAGIAVVAGLGLVGFLSVIAANSSNPAVSWARTPQDPGVNSDARGGPRGPGGQGEPSGQGGPGGNGGQGGPDRPGGPGGPKGELLHGEDVVKDSDGIKTLNTQQGTVTEVSETSITVKSSDDFLATYTVNGDTKVGKDGKQSAIADVKVGDTVHVNGTKTDGSLTANFIMDGKPPTQPAPPANGNQSKSTDPSPGTTTG